FSAATYPLRISYAHMPGPFFAHPAELQEWAIDAERNPYHPFFQEDTLPRLRSLAPDIVGISITYYGQLLPAVTLAALLKQNMPDVRIVFGGNIVSIWYDTLETCPEIFAWCDYLVPFEGESALHGLLKALDGGQSLAGVPNLVYLQEGIIHKNPVIVEDIDALPTPDYEGLPLDRYLAPETVFLLSTSRGCYWSQCLFCSVSTSMRRGCRTRSPQKIHRDIVTIHEKYNGRYITFGDDCVSPAVLADLTAILAKKGPEINWQCEVRFEEAFTTELLAGMRQTGCLNLIFGLESYSPRVLNRIRKGIRREEVERILEDCRHSGIAFNLQFFFGFPGESEAEAQVTVDFIKKQAHGAATFSFGAFELLRGSAVEKNPGKFQIRAVDRSVGPLAVAYDYTPVPGYAKRIKDDLMNELYGNIKYPYAGLSITAHTLLFLHLAGTGAMDKFYQKKEPGPKVGPDLNLMGHRLDRPEMQTVGSFAHLPQDTLPGTTAKVRFPGQEEEHLLLYDYGIDRLVEVSPIVVWLLKGLDGTRTPIQLIAHWEEENKAVFKGREAVHDALKELYKRGFCY
ncbi:MAG TPA: radical SAM protein, partial [Candidatus Deferrimicrobium sp.]|nr:radical SAM protein [Candidatus Deferrimicrobium sp.]